MLLTLRDEPPSLREQGIQRGEQSGGEDEPELQFAEKRSNGK
jgi:hypothetical protein